MYFRMLRDLREDIDWTQEDVAKIIYCCRGSYQRYETGARTIPVECLLLLAGFYDVSVDYLIGGIYVK